MRNLIFIFLPIREYFARHIILWGNLGRKIGDVAAICQVFDLFLNRVAAFHLVQRGSFIRDEMFRLNEYRVNSAQGQDLGEPAVLHFVSQFLFCLTLTGFNGFEI